MCRLTNFKHHKLKEDIFIKLLFCFVLKDNGVVNHSLKPTPHARLAIMAKCAIFLLVCPLFILQWTKDIFLGYFYLKDSSRCWGGGIPRHLGLN